jgi:hypothetical protein
MSSLVEATTRMAQVLFDDEESIPFEMLADKEDLNPFRDWILNVIETCGRAHE